MKRFCLLATILSVLFTACQDPNEPTTPKTPAITLALGNAVCDATAVTLTISATADDLDMIITLIESALDVTIIRR